ncbi:MAG: SprB repeat-containing protein, partial [Bacteroidia bacterium]|nr:SprB repeat-containing protein [Bacteroidia bacterium]
ASATQVQPVSCNGFSDGKGLVVVSGGTNPYSINWNSAPVQTTDSLLNVPAGTYIATVTDAQGCVDTAHVTISQPAILIASATVANHVSCHGGADGRASVSGTGGNLPYQFSWNTTPVQITPNVNGLSQGTYTVTITDAKGCQATAQVQINQPTQLLSSTTVINQVSCFNGSDGRASVTPSGGTMPYSYSWATSPVQNTQQATGLSAGTWFVTITDANGCTKVDSVQITQPSQLVIDSISVIAVSCRFAQDGSATVYVSGGTPSYSYLWSNNVSTQTISGLSGGTYSVTVTDSKGCTATSLTTVFEPSRISIDSFLVTPVSCRFGSNGSVTALVSGGSPGYTYQWSNGATSASINNLTSGWYYLVVTDSRGCSEDDSVFVSQPPSLPIVDAGPDVFICEGSSVVLSASVPSGQVCSFQWQPAAGLNNPFTLNPIASPDSTTEYVLIGY